MRSFILFAIFSLFFSAIGVLSQNFACERVFNKRVRSWSGFCSDESQTQGGTLNQAFSTGWGSNDESKEYYHCNAPKKFVYCCNGAVTLPTVKGCVSAKIISK
ncbi:hypothetical protein DFH28DRAFT_241255 [Melampsora americana]|nr:hypothetical protein DFH28DRAFT_241255 [Melampsora americana]